MAGFTGSPPGLSTDPLWAASGDIVYATGDDASSVLAVGSAGYVLTVNCDSTLKWAAGFTGPACSTDNAIPTFNGTGGATFQDTTVTISDSNVLTANAGIVVDNFTLDGTELDLSSGSFTLDVAADIEFNADGGDFTFKDGSLALAGIHNSSCVGELRIHEACNYIGFKAPALSGNQIWTLPAAVASCACDVLTCNGSGVLSWATASGGGVTAGGVDNAVLTANGTGGSTSQGTGVIIDCINDVTIPKGGASATGAVLAIETYNDGGNPARLKLRVSKHDTQGTHGAITSGLPLGYITFEGSDGDSFERGAIISAVPTQTWTGSARGTKLEFYTTNCNSTSNNLRMTLNPNGELVPAAAIYAADGSAGNPGYAFKCSTGIGFFHGGSNALAVGIGGSERARFKCAEFFIAETTNAKSTRGITINQTDAETETISLKSQDTHTFTCKAENDTYGLLRKASCADKAGLAVVGYSKNCGSHYGLSLEGNIGCSCNANSTAAVGAINMRVADTHLNTLGGMGCTENLISISNNGVIYHLVKGNGDIHTATGSITDEWDAYCDVALLTAARGIMASCKSLDFKQSLSGFVNEYACVLEQSGVVSLNRDTDSVPFMSHNAMFGLIIDTIRQVGGRVAGLEAWTRDPQTGGVVAAACTQEKKGLKGILGNMGNMLKRKKKEE